MTDARRASRAGPEGELIPLTEQDRSRWDQGAIAEGVALITATLPRGSIGAYQVQAAIAAVHDEAARAEDTDWPQILALYEVLMRMSDNPMVALSHAIATAMVHGPAAGLELLSALDADARMTGTTASTPSARTCWSGRATRGSHRALPESGRPHDEHPGAELPGDAGSAAPRRGEVECRDAAPPWRRVGSSCSSVAP